MTDKKTSPEVGSDASDVIRDGRTGDDSKSAGGSALSQRNPNRETGDDAASASSDVLKDDDTGDKSKSAAGSALSQTPPQD